MITKENSKRVIAENLELIFRNHVRYDALAPMARGESLKEDDVFVDAHLMDRAGAIVNALKARGYRLDAEAAPGE